MPWKAMIYITNEIAISEHEISIDFVRASGPGGQNVNKVATAAQLRFDVAHAASLPEAVRLRLARLAGRRLTGEGVLIIEAKRFRSQEQNRRDAVERLVALLQKAARKPTPRRKTRPTRAAKERRLTDKKRRGGIKSLRARGLGAEE
jgi:ribosome-associated protein